jgi:uncharacterized membrane protein
MARLKWMLGPLAPRPHLAGAIAVGVGVAALLAWRVPQLTPSTWAILGWDALCLTFISTMLGNMARTGDDTDAIRARAAQDDEGRALILTLVLAAALASLAAIAAELSLARGASGLVRSEHVTLAFVTVAASWFMVQTIFAVHYAHLYYEAADGGGDAQGLAFPGGEQPDYWDFLHFSVVIGVACQTADVAFTSKGMRRLGTVHGLMAFAFNTVVVALTINLLAGLF